MRFRLSERSWLALLAGLAALLFLVANRGAYEGFFSDDDLDNLGWTTTVGADVFRQGFWSPLFSPHNFRPTGHFYYRVMHALGGLDFRWHLAALQLLHLGNAALAFALSRTLGASAKGALSGAVFFLFHPALFAAFWKPMYIFDVLCASFLLLSLLLYLRDRWLLALLGFWLAYKAKEVALFYPAVLVLLEYAGQRRWLRTVPFLAVSLSFGLQAALANRGGNTDYTLRFTLAAVVTCGVFYLGKVAPALLAGAWFGRADRRIWCALAAFLVLVGPLWFLPGRLFAVYLYVPMLALVVAVAFLVEPVRPMAIGVALAAWLGFVYLGPLRDFRKAELTIARESRIFFERTCQKLPGVDPRGSAFVEGGPLSLALHGVEGAIHLCYSPELKLIRLDPQTEGWRQQAPAGTPALSWNSSTRQMQLLRDEDSAHMNVFRLGTGWYPFSGGLRWSAPVAEALLTQPPGAGEFYLEVRPTPGQIARLKSVQIMISLDGAWIGDAELDQPGPWARGWPVPAVATPTRRRVDFRITPGYRAPGDHREYGLPFADFSFRQRPQQAK